MERRGTLRRATAPMIMAALAALGGLAACGDDGSETNSAAEGRPAAAPSESTSTTTTTAPCTFSGGTAEAEGNQDAFTRLLTGVRLGTHGCYDRVTFEFKPQAGEAPGPVAWHAAYEVPPITEDGSGQTVPVKGTAFLVIRFSAAGVDLSQESAPETYTGPESLEPADATRIRQVRRIGDFEGVLTWVIGLDGKRPFSVSTAANPARVVIDLGD